MQHDSRPNPPFVHGETRHEEIQPPASAPDRDERRQAVLRNLLVFWQALRDLPDLSVNAQPDVTTFVGPLPHTVMNGALGADFAPGDAGRRVREVREAFVQLGRPCLWWTGPEPTPGLVREALQDAGFLPAGSSTAMIADLRGAAGSVAPPIVDLSVTRVGTPACLRDFLRVIGGGFALQADVREFFGRVALHFGLHEESRMQNFVGYHREEPVACCTVFFGAGVAGVYNVATLTAMRRRGFGASMTHAGLQFARDAGYTTAILHATEPGRGVYARLGFDTCGEMQHHLWVPGSDPEGRTPG